MCFTVSIFASTHAIETATGALFEGSEDYTPYVYVSGFVFPSLPIVTNEDSSRIQLFEWGLIPRWTKNAASAADFRRMTLNARSETVYEKPSFRDAISKRRALLPINGFLEWRHEGTLKLPHYVCARDRSLLTVGCIWEEWTDRDSGECHKTFSIVTTEANELMSYVHNTKLRMPVIISPEDRQLWLMADDRAQVTRLFRPLQEGLLEARPVTKEVSKIKVNRSEYEFLEPIGPIRS